MCTGPWQWLKRRLLKETQDADADGEYDWRAPIVIRLCDLSEDLSGERPCSVPLVEPKPCVRFRAGRIGLAEALSEAVYRLLTRETFAGPPILRLPRPRRSFLETERGDSPVTVTIGLTVRAAKRLFEKSKPSMYLLVI